MDGILLIDKPVGITSHDVVARVRRSLNGAKTGHAGTLDPFASGLLVVLVGKATKLQSRIMELPKRYETVARLGALSSTGDPEGEITETRQVAARSAGAADGRDSANVLRSTRRSRSKASALTARLVAASPLRCPSGS